MTNVTQAIADPVRWTNWVGNQSFSCNRHVAPARESEIASAVRDASLRRSDPMRRRRSFVRSDR